MKINRGILRITFAAIVLTALVASCTKTDSGRSNSYFVSKKFITGYKKDVISGLVDLVSFSDPDVAGIKPFITSDVDVYSLAYKTTVNGKQLNASGIISVPTTPGSYPVLSFQNGTNTVNAGAPSEAPNELTYRMVEILASMGYIVVIADYPGFGESSQIPHPYLVKDPTVTSLVDLLYSVKELNNSGFSGITIKNEYYLIGYSQGGWATLALHKALEQDYKSDFTLKGSSCGAGPYNILKLLEGMINQPSYPVPAYLAYIVNAYLAYNQFTNPVTDIFNEPYASRVGSLFNGTLTLTQIDNQLTTSIPGLITPEFLTGFQTQPKYSGVRDALTSNSISPWNTDIPVLFLHGNQDTQVSPSSTDDIVSGMLNAGTSPSLIQKIIIPNVGHTDGAIPSMIQGILFINNLKITNNSK